MRRAGVALALAIAVTLAAPRPARAIDDEPDDKWLVLAGAGMAIPDYVYGVFQHEGSHALWAKLFGAHIVKFHLLPGMADGHFYFGYTQWRGDLTRNQIAWVLVAPKLPDVLLMTGFSLLVGFHALPKNDYGALALTVIGTGAWVDFSKDMFSWNDGGDLVKIHNLYGRRSEWQRLPYRVVHFAISAGFAYFLTRGYLEVFGSDDKAPPIMFNVLRGAF